MYQTVCNNDNITKLLPSGLTALSTYPSFFLYMRPCRRTASVVMSTYRDLGFIKYFEISLCTILVISCFSKTTTNAYQNGTSNLDRESSKMIIYFGAFYPLSGPFSQWGKGCLPAAQLAVNHINNRSDVLKDYQIQLINMDTQVVFMLAIIFYGHLLTFWCMQTRFMFWQLANKFFCPSFTIFVNRY